MNLRRSIPTTMVHPKKEKLNLLNWFKNWLFWRKAKKRHKFHANIYAIFEEDDLFYAAKYDWSWGWRFLDRTEYLDNWSEGQRRRYCSHKTRYSALRCIAKNRPINLNRC